MFLKRWGSSTADVARQETLQPRQEVESGDNEKDRSGEERLRGTELHNVC